MNPSRVTATNYRTFDHLDVDLPTGCVAIVGPNGAGKSSIVNLVDVGLFAARGELPALLTTGESDLEIQVEFEHAGELYRVRRQYSARGRGKTTLDFEYWKTSPLHSGDDTGPCWESLTRENADQTQQLIEQTLGLTRTTFRASSFLRQGDGAAFTEANPAERKAILAEILTLDRWERMQRALRIDLTGAKDEQASLQTRLELAEHAASVKNEITSALTTYRALAKNAADKLIVAERDLEKAREAKAANAAAAERHQACQQAHNTAAAELARAERALADIDAALAGRPAKQQQFDKANTGALEIPALEERLTAIQAYTTIERSRRDLAATIEQRETARGRLVDESIRLDEQRVELERKATHVEQHLGEACSTCGQPMGKVESQRAAAAYREQADVIGKRANMVAAQTEADLAEIAALMENLAAIELPEPPIDTEQSVQDELRARRQDAERRGGLAEQLLQLTELAGKRADLVAARDAAAKALDARRSELEYAKANVVSEEDLDRNLRTASLGVDEFRTQEREARDSVVRCEQQLEQATAAEAETVELAEERDQVGKRIDQLTLADRAFGRDGIPALIVEAVAIPQIELEANRILDELGTDLRLELRTQRALKTSDALKETLDIVIQTGAGERPYETFSGGERTRLNLALRIALARLLARRRGAESRLLAIDEPEFLDEQGTARLGDVLRGLSGDFERVLLVSHHPTLAAAFDTTLVVVKDGDSSRVIDDAPVAVAA